MTAISKRKRSNQAQDCSAGLESQDIQTVVADVLATTKFIDIHTHLFPPSFGELNLWGVDSLLTYHYLEAEFFRSSHITPGEYFRLAKAKRADAIWQSLFVDNAPISEATRGVVAVLSAFGLPTGQTNLSEARHFFASQDIDGHVRKTFNLAGIDTVVMTNDPLDPEEQKFWSKGQEIRSRFRPALRLDRILNDWSSHWQILVQQGYAVDAEVSGKSVKEIRRFLSNCQSAMSPLYTAVSLPDTFAYPDDSSRTRILKDAVLPSCQERQLPLSLMIGVRRQVNPRIRLAGDAVGRADLRALETLCHDFPDNRFLVSVLSRENQHELCVYARKFSNLMPFGCWWFLNNSSIVEEITKERIEMLGASFIPQHSDARVLEQVIYKWKNTRAVLGKVLTDTYAVLLRDGRRVTRDNIQNDVTRMFRSNFENWTSIT
jgi:hypothetical protein